MAVDNGKMLAWALGREKAPLVLKNAKLVNVLSGEIYPADIAIGEGVIVGVGEYAGEEEVDLAGRFVYPGLIDGHFHFESSMVCPEEFAAAVVRLYQDQALWEKLSKGGLRNVQQYFSLDAARGQLAQLLHTL